MAQEKQVGEVGLERDARRRPFTITAPASAGTTLEIESKKRSGLSIRIEILAVAPHVLKIWYGVERKI